MRNLLNIVCLAFSVYYVFTAPTTKPALKSTTGIVKTIIDELKNLTSVSVSTVYIQSLYPDAYNKTFSIMEISCRAHKFIKALNDKSKPRQVEYLLEFFTKDNCKNVTYEERKRESDMKSFMYQLLKAFQNHLYTST